MFTTAEGKTRFSESHVCGLLTSEINRQAFHVQIVLASVPFCVGSIPWANAPCTQLLTPQASCQGSCPALSLPSVLRNHPAAPTGMPAPGISARAAEFPLPHLLPCSATGCFSTADGNSVWMHTELRDRPRSHRPANPQHRVSSLPPGGLGAGYPLCPRLWSAVRSPPGWKSLRTPHLTAMALICTSTKTYFYCLLLDLISKQFAE